MGREAGMKTALVMTGVTDAKTLEAFPVRPDYVLRSIADMDALL
jgi:ribonucleotide monophosphatase NagD (HAD superfamily)